MGNAEMAGTPPSDLNQFIEQWEKAQKQYDLDRNELAAMLLQMAALAKKGEVGAAFQMAQMSVIPETTQLQGDQMATLAATMNIASAFQEFTTAAQNDMNNGGKMTTAQGDAFVNFIKEFYGAISMSPPPKWLDAGTQKQLMAAIDKICQSFGCTGPNDPNFTGDKVAEMISSWSNDPTGKIWIDPNDPNHQQINPGEKTGQQCLQDLQAGFTQWNNTESAQSQVLQSQEQFAGHVFNQYMNTCADIFQASQKQAQTMVQNQRVQ